MKSIYFVLDKNILPKTTTIEWKSAIISRAKPVMASCPHPQHPQRIHYHLQPIAW